MIDERNGRTSLRICRNQRSWELLPSGFLENVVFLAKITPYKATSLLARMEDAKAKTHKSNCVGIPVEAVRKLKFLGGERAVGILIGALGNLKGMKQEGEKAFEQCIEPSIYSGLHRTPEQDAYIRKVCDHDRYFGHVRAVNGLLMKTLAEMVKDPPLSADARATSENFQKWRAWWTQNKDHAVFVQRLDQSFE